MKKFIEPVLNFKSFFADNILLFSNPIGKDPWADDIFDDIDGSV